MGSQKIKFLLQLSLISGLCYSALAKEIPISDQCKEGSSSCCQQVLECNGVCSIEHPDPDNEAAWYVDSFCDQKRGCRCWKKGQCCEYVNECCDSINGTCTMGKPPKSSNFQAVLPCDRNENCFCWQRKPCVDDNKWCKENNGICQHFPPTDGNWTNIGYCDWSTDCKCWVKDCTGNCLLKTDKCSRDNPGYPWFKTGRKCNEDGCGCWRECKPYVHCTKKNGRCQPTSPGRSFTRIGRCKNEGCYCWAQNCNQTQSCEKAAGRCMNASPGSDYHLVGDCENGCKCWAKCNDVEQQCLKKRGECLAEDPNPIGQILYTKIGICQGGCDCWVKRQEPDCSGGKCPFATDECNNTNPDPLLNYYDRWLNSTEICNKNGCTCWRQCKKTNSCSVQLGKCFATNQSSIGYEFLGDCKNGCQCWRPCSNEKCLNKGGHCSSRGRPGIPYEMIGDCTNYCKCWRSCND